MSNDEYTNKQTFPPFPTTINDTNYAWARTHKHAHIHPLACIGTPAEWIGELTNYPAIIHQDAIIREFARVHAGTYQPTTIGRGTLLMAGSHVGHDATLGENVQVAPNATIGGCVTIGDNVKIGMNASIKPHVTIGDGARIGQGAVVLKDVPPGEVWVGNPARRLNK